MWESYTLNTLYLTKFVEFVVEFKSKVRDLDNQIEQSRLQNCTYRIEVYEMYSASAVITGTG